jgi:phosphatidylglycerophosphate synthase
MNEPVYQPIERRPIQSRNTRWAEAVTQWLVRVGASPNGISILGAFFAVVGGCAFYATSIAADSWQRMFWLAGGLMCQLRLLCNLFDGMVAVQRGIASRTGELYNEVPDRISDAVILIGIGYAVDSDITLGYIAALTAIFTAYVRATAKSIGAPNDFCGPMAKPQRMALVTLLAIYLAVWPTTWRLAWSEPKIVLVIVIAGCLLTSTRRLSRAAKYLQGTNV